MKNKLYITMRPVMGNINKTGKCVIRCRITYNKQRKEFSTGLFITPDHWNSRKQKVLDDTENSEYINTQLSLIINKSIQRFRKPIRVPVSEGYLDKDPFLLYKPKTTKKKEDPKSYQSTSFAQGLENNEYV